MFVNLPSLTRITREEYVWAVSHTILRRLTELVRVSVAAGHSAATLCLQNLMIQDTLSRTCDNPQYLLEEALRCVQERGYTMTIQLDSKGEVKYTAQVLKLHGNRNENWQLEIAESLIVIPPADHCWQRFIGASRLLFERSVELIEAGPKRARPIKASNN